MDAVVRQTESAVDRLVGLVDTENPFDMPFSEVLPRQLEAINERFKDRIEKIKLLQNRAESGGITEIRTMADIVPLLFAHTAYKSYPEGWLVEQKWDRLGRWLDTVSTNRVRPMDTSGIKGLDEWLHRLEEQSHYVSCSSGTTGKCAMMNATMADCEFAGHSLLQALIWAGLAPNHDRRMIALGQVAATPRNRASGKPMREAFNRPDVAPFAPNVPPITIGGITEMIVLRKKIADGTAKPTEIAYFEAQVIEREKAIESSIEQAADALIESRHMPLHIMGIFGPLYKVAERVRAKGYSGKDFRENSGFVSGGLKRVQVPSNYREFIFETLNLSPARLCLSYGMQEANTNAPRCSAGRYHLAPWVMLLLLDESGENLIEPSSSGELEGRAAFFDLSLDGRWGGVISGDKIRATWAPCACGNRGPSVSDDIQRYADMASGDKIACSGTIDAYVRGVA
jgi:hypothetical protein